MTNPAPDDGADDRQPAPPGGQLGGLRLGRVSGFDRARRELSLHVIDSGAEIAAQLAVGLEPQQLEAASKGELLAVLAFNESDARPLVIGFVPAPATAPPGLAPGKLIEADVDGRRVQITALDEVVFQCGKASITLRRNGKVVIRGTHVETHADGTNRIKGGQVRIN